MYSTKLCNAWRREKWSYNAYGNALLEPLTGLTDNFCSILMGLIFIGGLGLPTKEGNVPNGVVGCKNGTSLDSVGLKKDVVIEGAPGRESGGVVESNADGMEFTFFSEGVVKMIVLSSSSLNHFSSSSSIA